MYEPNVVQGCDSMVGSIAIIAIIVTAFTTMLGLVKPADTVKYCGVIVGIAVVLVTNAKPAASSEWMQRITLTATAPVTARLSASALKP